jgi:hypothetical protein
MDDEEHEDDTEGDEKLGTVPENARRQGTPPQAPPTGDGNPHAYASCPTPPAFTAGAR